MASLPFSILPAVVGVACGSLFPSREQSRSFVLDQISCGPRTSRPPPPRANGRASPKRAAINRTTAVATADCNESAIHERAESRVFEMGVGVTCRKWIKKEWKSTASLSPFMHFRISISFANRKSRTHAAITLIGCRHANPVHFDVDRSAVRKGRGGGAAVGIESLIGH